MSYALISKLSLPAVARDGGNGGVCRIFVCLVACYYLVEAYGLAILLSECNLTSDCECMRN